MRELHVHVYTCILLLYVYVREVICTKICVVHGLDPSIFGLGPSDLDWTHQVGLDPPDLELGLSDLDCPFIFTRVEIGPCRFGLGLPYMN